MNNGSGSQNLVLWLRALEFSTAALDLCSHIDPALRTTLLVDQIEALAKNLPPMILDAGKADRPAESSQLYLSARANLLEAVKLFDALENLNWISENQLNYLHEHSAFLETNINQQIKLLQREK